PSNGYGNSDQSERAEPEDERRPVGISIARGVYPDEGSPEAEGCEEGEPRPGRETGALSGSGRFPRRKDDPADRDYDSRRLDARGSLAAREAHRHRDDGCGRSDRRDDAHRTAGQPAVQRG